MTSNMPRTAWKAGLLSLLLPGLGQLYNGQAYKGLRWYCVLVGTTMLLLALMLESRLSPLSLGGSLFLYIALYATIAGDAVRVARQYGVAFQPKWYNRWYVYATAILVAPFVLHPAMQLPWRAAPVRAYNIASRSMEPTLRVGDHILAAPRSRSNGLLKRHDIVVFDAPGDQTQTFLKRIVALPGERVAVHQSQLWVNGQPIREPYIDVGPAHDIEYDDPVIAPQQGDILDIRDDEQLYVNGKPVALSGDGFKIYYSRFFPPGASLQMPSGPVTVQDNHYFVLGDRRYRSRDSRTWGFVPERGIQGRVIKVYWSWDDAAKRVRWDRIGLDFRR